MTATPRRPDTPYDAVLWWSFSLFYLVAGLTVTAWVLEAPLRLTIAGVVATGFAYIGAWHAREIHVNNRVGQSAAEQPKFYDPRDTQN